MLRRNRLKNITAYNFFDKKCIRSIIYYTSLNGNELVLDLHHSIHTKGKQFIMPEDFDPENKDEFFTIKPGDYIVEGECEETKRAGIIEAGGFMVESVEIACESFGTPVVIKVMLTPLVAEGEDEEQNETTAKEPKVEINEESAIEEEAKVDETPEEVVEAPVEATGTNTPDEPKENSKKKGK